MLPMLSKEREKLPFFGLRDEIDRLFDDFFVNGDGKGAFFGRRMPAEFLPAIDVKEGDASFLIEVEVPGLKSSEVDVQVEEGMLVLRGERKQEKEEKTRMWHRSERYWGKFERRIALPDHAELEKVEAACKDGVLYVTVPKKPGSKPKTISVKVK
jgi:HSP20 family protein